ncbi:MAG: hypothetical protein IKH81_00825 [Clostridia bacterium]|nr:hypothetical protein [Clostridia bacterium]
MKKIIGLILLLLLCAGLCSAAAEELTPPTDFTFDTETGEFSFTDNDTRAGYYFVRVFPVINGAETGEYVASSKRFTGGKPGKKSGVLKLDDMGWGEYHAKLLTYHASGTSYADPEPVVLDVFYGVGGKLEKPEMMVVTDGNTIEVTLDWYTYCDWADEQFLPILRVTVYADDALTEIAAEEDFELASMIVDGPPFGGYILPYSAGSGHMNFESVSNGSGGGPSSEEQAQSVKLFCLTPEVTLTVPGGDYYVVCQGVSYWEEQIASSERSDIIPVTVTDEAPNGEFEAFKTASWQDPNGGEFPTVPAGGAQGRQDEAQGQTVSSFARQ